MKKNRSYLLTALILAVLMCVTDPASAAAAPKDADMTGQPRCRLSVYPVDMQDQDKQEYWEDMKTAGVVIDLYKESSLEPSDLQGVTAEQVESMAQEAFQSILEGGQAAKDSVAASETGAVFSNLETGVYLLIARGDEMTSEEYVKILSNKTEDGTVERLSSIARSRGYEYYFAPQLLVLPSISEDGVIQMDGTAVLKSERKMRYGSLEIRKTLKEYEVKEGKTPKPVDFVFHAVGRIDGEVVYDAYDKISFTGDGIGDQTVRMDWIPAGAEVTVTEVYSGASYQLSVPGDRKAVIEAGQIASVEFENEYDGRQTNGHGIKNQFVYDAETGSWKWYSDPGQESPGSQGLPSDEIPEYLEPRTAGE